MKNKFCCLCLVKEVGVYDFVTSDSKHFFERIIKELGNVKVFHDNLYICYECKALLEKSYKFIQKAITVQQILQVLHEEANEITNENLKPINRLKLGIDTNLTKQEIFIIDVCCNLIDNDKDKVCSDESESDIKAGENIFEQEAYDNNPLTDIKDYDVKTSYELESSVTLDTKIIVELNSTEAKKDDIDLVDEHSIIENDGTSIDIHHEEVKKSSKNNYVDIKEIRSQNAPLENGIIDLTLEEHTIYENEEHENKIKLKSKKIRKEINDDDDYKVNQNYKKKYKKIKRKAVAKDSANKIKRKRTTYVLSNFMLSLPSFADKKRERADKKYVYSDNESRSSLSSNKNTPITNKNIDDEYEPQSSTNSEAEEEFLKYANFTERGPERLNPRDLRQYPMECDHCDVEIPEKKVHYHHYMFCHPKIPYPYTNREWNLLCQFCGKAFDKKHRHAAHELTHSSEKTFACSKCPKKFKNRVNLYGHLKSTHTDKLYECDYCGKKSKTRSDLMLHIRIHTGEKPFKCHICGYGLAHKGNVAIHIRSKHQGQPPKTKKKQTQHGLETGTVSVTDEDEPLVNIKKKKLSKKKFKKSKCKKKSS